MSRVKHHEDVFYRLIDDFGTNVVAAADLYKDIIYNFSPENGRVQEFRDMEHTCDACVRAIMVELAQSFITPFDREDIAALAHKMDDIVDSMYGVVQRLTIFHVDEVRPSARDLADITVNCTHELKILFEHLPNFKKDKVVREQTEKIKLLEDDGDDTYHIALGHLYDGGIDTVDVIKWNKLYDTMEAAIDACEECAYVVDGVVIKNA